MKKGLSYLCFFFLIACSAQDKGIVTGAEQIEKYLPLLEGKSIAIVGNHTSMIGKVHLVDTLYALSKGQYEIKKVFAPEHGFRGDADAGALVKNGVDSATGIPIISLYGKNKKPSEEQLEGIDLVVFDIQDIGVRFYTYISTLHYVMQACAENDVMLLVLDRPNPNGNYVDGPVLEPAYRSFVGMHEIPVVHGLTIGELATMINGEGWLGDETQGQSLGMSNSTCNLEVIRCLNYDHAMAYSLPIKPSPNLPNDHSIRIYPSTCFFEGTVISEGRGTMNPFEVYGHPKIEGDYSFIPQSIKGMSMHPKLKGQICNGEDLRSFIPEGGWSQIELKWLIDAYEKYPDKNNFFSPFFDKLAGTSSLREQIEAGCSEQKIRTGYSDKLNAYLKLRKSYLLYSIK